MRAALYARYSSENQHERSIEDQVRLCSEFAARQGWTVVASFKDYAISGASLKTRPDAQRLLEAALAHQFDIVLTEALDRLSRDLEDIAGISKRLEFSGVRLWTVSEGEIGPLHIGLKGTMNALFLKDLAAKTKRGARGRIEKGRSAGGRAYGYKIVRALGAAGEVETGLRTIDETEAAIVRRIFQEFAAGTTARDIARRLNRDGVRAPFGGQWSASTINGNAQRGSGVLFNPIYVGRLVYNRVTMVKDPETGKRISRPNPPSAWIEMPAPTLRIVDDKTWSAVQARKRATAGLPLTKRAPPARLLTGLLTCGCCGGAFTINGRDRLGCSARRERGTCNNRFTVTIADVERRVLDGLKCKLLRPEVVRHALAEYHAERQRLRHAERQTERTLVKRLARIKTEIDKLVDRICDGTDTPALNTKLKALDGAGGEREQLEQELAALEQNGKIAELHPGAIEAWTQLVERLERTLGSEPLDQNEARMQLRSMIEKITVEPPTAEGGDYKLVVFGRLAEILNLPSARSRSVRVVAGAGLEPATLGL